MTLAHETMKTPNAVQKDELEALIDLLYGDICFAEMSLLALEELEVPPRGDTPESRAYENVLGMLNGLCLHVLVMTLASLMDRRDDVASVPKLLCLLNSLASDDTERSVLATDYESIRPQLATAVGRIQIHRHKLVAHRAYPFDAAKFMLEHGLAHGDFSSVLSQIRALVDKYSQLFTGTTTDTSAPPEILKEDLAWFLKNARPNKASKEIGAGAPNPHR